MEIATILVAESGVHLGREQRMGEPDGLVSRCDHVRRTRPGEPGVRALSAHHHRQQREGRMRESRSARDGLARRWSQGRQPLAKQPGERSGQWDEGHPSIVTEFLEGPADLHGMQGVAIGHPLDATKHRRGEVEAEHVSEEPIDGFHRQPLDGHIMNAARRNVGQESRRRAPGPNSLGGQDDHRLPLEAAQREHEDSRARLVQPRHVVDGKGERLVRGRETEELERRERERKPRHRLTVRVRTLERDVQCALLWRWQVRQFGVH